MNQLDPALEARIRQLTPISDLPRSYQDNVIAQGEVLSLAHGEFVFREDSQDDYIHYLLDGSVNLLMGGVTSRRISSISDIIGFPLDEGGVRRKCSASVNHAARIFRIKHSALARATDLAATAPPPHPDEVIDITDADPSDWIVVTLRDGLFAHLPVETIQHVLSRVEEMNVSAGDVVLAQGGLADYFYLIKEGSAAVTRRPAPDAPAVHLATIKPGGGFGEEALIANCTRNATVTMISDGVLMKLTREDFNTLIRDPLLKSVSLEQGEREVAADAVWLDVRDAERYRISRMAGAVNVPLPLLRLKWRELDPAREYVVYSEDGSASAVAAFLLSSRGIQVQYVDDAVFPPLPDPMTMTDEADSAPPGGVTIVAVNPTTSASATRADAARANADDTETAPADPTFYADTQTGKGLAELVAKINADNAQLASRSVADLTETTISGAANIGIDENFFDLELDQLAAAPRSAESAQEESAQVVGAAERDAISNALEQLEASVRAQVEAARAQERERVEQHIQERVARVQKQAELLIRKKLLEARARDKERIAKVEDRLRQRYEQLQRLTNKITHQKAEIQRARRKLGEKLRTADELHRELSTLGHDITAQIDDLEEMMPGENLNLAR